MIGQARTNVLSGLSDLISRLTLPTDPFGNQPRGKAEDYRELHRAAEEHIFPHIDEFELNAKRRVDPNWLSNLALHTQVVKKDSELNWQHGRILYSSLSHLVDASGDTARHFTVFETGTARGFSAIVMARALIDREVAGTIVTVDSIPHNSPMYWNCIDDFEGPRTRAQLIDQWPVEAGRIVFLQKVSPKHLHRIGLRRINFAFLDAQHTKESVLGEFEFVRARQNKGDLIVFDDVTPGIFDGVVAAVEAVKESGHYEVALIGGTDYRCYAIARKL